jgi:hypothetical protein
MQKAKVFRYRKSVISDDRRVLHFFYEVETEQKMYDFQESIGLPTPLPPEIPESFIASIMSDLHLILGISYFKAFCPPVIDLGPIKLSSEQAGFWNTVYTSGLGEFYYRNKIDYRDLVHFPSTDGVQQSTSLSTADRVLTGVSGGRDSLVTIELLKKHTIPVSGFFVTNSTVPPFIEQTIKQSSVETMIVKRQIDPKLIELNKEGHVYNGHIPVSIIYALIGVLLAGLSDDQIREEIQTFKTELAELEDTAKIFKKMTEIRPRVFALTREVAKRTLNQPHYDVQIVGGIALSEGKIAEMKTGEGKTLTATLPIVLHALAGRGSHLVTVNDYLSRWHASSMS